ncbi:hypothetical protein NMY3_02697 [Candidatus Nitrosocosmicus oleophilus]|uniref:Uncharacterized protein n=1 Tax=Candidatus Nitrosocosmicus oleophilus TaxID=1353260 RepID=A0A654M146_9ARCH|nr:hypothetical protein NMY3_02697 [Candidatus Nitrosocosmicus oleophilus]
MGEVNSLPLKVIINFMVYFSQKKTSSYLNIGSLVYTWQNAGSSLQINILMDRDTNINALIDITLCSYFRSISKKHVSILGAL